jgi:transposase
VKSHYRVLLGLNELWDVSGVTLDVSAKSVTISLEYRGRGGACPECGAECGLKDHAPERTWRHLDTMQFETLLKARIPRVNCGACGVKTMAVPWGEKHSRFTLMFEAFAIDVLQCAGSVKAGAALLGLSWDAAHEIMKRAVDRGLQTRQLEGVRCVGIDEKSFGSGQDYVSVMVDVNDSRVLEVAEGRTSKSADVLWNSLSEQQKSQISAVTIDMWQAYENSVAVHAPQAEIVFDRFHISKHLNEGVDKVRRDEHRELKQRGDERLTGTRYLFLFNAEQLDNDRQQELNALQKQQLRTSRAWAIKDYFRWFWDEPDAIAGREFFNHWYNWAIRSRLEPMKKVARMLKQRVDNILTWFRHRITNSTAEGFNSRIQSLKSNARGFRSFNNYRTRILFFCGKLNLKPHL